MVIGGLTLLHVAVTGCVLWKFLPSTVGRTNSTRVLRHSGFFHGNMDNMTGPIRQNPPTDPNAPAPGTPVVPGTTDPADPETGQPVEPEPGPETDPADDEDGEKD